MTELEQREAVVKEALSWANPPTPYHAHAQLKSVGVDCAHLLIAVFGAVGLIPKIDPGFYSSDWHLHRSEEKFSDWLARYAKLADGPFALGDVLLWRFGRTFSHGSIYVGDELVVHAYVGRGVIVSRLTDEPLGGRDLQHWSLW